MGWIAGRASTHGRKWRKIASQLGGRSPFQCRWRLETALSPDRKDWSPDDSARLLELFREVGPQWALMAQQIRSRSDCELRKIFLREHRDAYTQWLRDHDVAQRDRTAEHPCAFVKQFPSTLGSRVVTLAGQPLQRRN